jgi:hypothetical protein
MYLLAAYNEDQARELFAGEEVDKFYELGVNLRFNL